MCCQELKRNDTSKCGLTYDDAWTVSRRAGCRRNRRLITAIDGKSVSSKNDLLLAVETDHRPGDTIKLTVFRDGQTITVPVTLGEQ